MNYSDKLKDPRWQKKRLEILQRDDFTCQFCCDNESLLVVHHFKYDGEPWETEDRYLITLCEDCHDYEHKQNKKYKKLLENTLIGLESDGYRAVASIINSININNNMPLYTLLDILEQCFQNENFYKDVILKYWHENICKVKI